MKTLILTKDYREYSQLPESVQQSTTYVHNISDLRGLQGLSIQLVGNYASRPDWESIQEYLKFASFNISYG